MKPIYQTRYGKRELDSDPPAGNCFQAALASLFELPLEEVPDFCNIYSIETDEWYKEYIKWLNSKGFSSVTVLIDSENDFKDDLEYKGCILLVTGINKDGINHCVIYKNGEPIHNPNKTCIGITPKSINIIFPLDPVK